MEMHTMHDVLYHPYFGIYLHPLENDDSHSLNIQQYQRQTKWLPRSTWQVTVCLWKQQQRKHDFKEKWCILLHHWHVCNACLCNTTLLESTKMQCNQWLWHKYSVFLTENISIKCRIKLIFVPCCGLDLCHPGSRILQVEEFLVSMETVQTASQASHVETNHLPAFPVFRCHCQRLQMTDNFIPLCQQGDHCSGETLDAHIQFLRDRSRNTNLEEHNLTYPPPLTPCSLSYYIQIGIPCFLRYSIHEIHNFC